MTRKLVALISAVVACVCVPPAFAQDIWTTSGFSGIVDEADTHLHLFNSTGSVSIRTSISGGTLHLRYPVNALGPMGLNECMMLRARLRDTGAGARVLVRLIALDITTGQRSLLGQIDSDAVRPPADPTDYALYRTCLNYDKILPFDFVFFTYYVEAELTKTTANANPGLMAVQICGADRCEGAGR
jgi:hypothetical protein